MKDKEDIKDEKEPKTTDDTKQESSRESDDGITVSEEYQKKAHEVTHKATKHHLNHLRGKMNEREDEIRKEEESKKPKDKAPKEFDADPSY